MLYEGVAEQSTGRSLGIAPGHCNGTCLTISASRRRDLMRGGRATLALAPNCVPPWRYVAAIAAGSLPQTNCVLRLPKFDGAPWPVSAPAPLSLSACPAAWRHPLPSA